MTFKLKTILGIAIIEIVFISILVGRQVVNLSDQAELEMLKRAEAIGNLFSSAARNAVISFDLAALKEHVASINKHKGMVYSKVIRENRTLAQSGITPKLSKGFIQDVSLKGTTDGVFDTQYPILVDGKEFAFVQFGLSVGDILHAIKDKRNEAIYIGIILLTLSALFSYLLGTYLTNSLSELQMASASISQGNFDVEVKEIGHDEISKTAKAFNLMVRNIKSQLAELEEQKQKADEASKAKSLFLANMSHEIRTPLNTIVNFIRFIRDSKDQENQKDYLRKIEVSSKALMAIVNDVLDISKIEANEFGLEFIEFDLHQLLLDLVELFEDQIKEKGLILTCNFEKVYPFVFHSDPTRVRQLLFNLISNAVKFTSSGEITVTACLEKSQGESANIRLEVKDTGVGIPKEKINKIFEAFVQADNSTLRRYGGTGLGLAICKEIVEKLSGEIIVTSDAGKGTRFLVTLPISLKEKGESNSKDQKARLDVLPKNSILVCEDNMMNQMVMKVALAKMGQNPVFAKNGAEGFQLFCEGHFDMVFMDFQMPECDGFEAVQKIRDFEAKNNRPRTPVVALTANAIEADKRRALKLGMDDYLTKPFDMDNLSAVVKKWSSQEGSEQGCQVKSS